MFKWISEFVKFIFKCFGLGIDVCVIEVGCLIKDFMLFNDFVKVNIFVLFKIWMVFLKVFCIRLKEIILL